MDAQTNNHVGEQLVLPGKLAMIQTSMIYLALKAIEASGSCAAPELDLQLAKLPDHLRAMVLDSVMPRLAKLGIMKAGRLAT